MIAGDRNPVGDRRHPTTRTLGRHGRPSARRQGVGLQPSIQLDLVVDGSSLPAAGAVAPASLPAFAEKDCRRADTIPTAADGRTRAHRLDAEQPLVLTAAQVEAALQIGRTRTYELLRSGQIPVLRVGRLIRVSRAALEQWIAQHGTAGPGDDLRDEGSP